MSVKFHPGGFLQLSEAFGHRLGIVDGYERRRIKARSGDFLLVHALGIGLEEAENAVNQATRLMHVFVTLLDEHCIGLLVRPL